MIKVWLLIVMISQPNLPSVRTNSFLYGTEESCMQSLTNYLNIYESKPLEYKENLKSTGFCLPFDYFPIQGMHKISL